MFLEVLTLIVLVGVLLTKYGTSVHIQKLNQRQLELENSCKQFRSRLRALKQERTAIDAEERELQPGLRALETQLDELRGKLQEQEERNRELQDRGSGAG